jgi:transcriptional regulator with XRE-family HTH domain
MTFAEPNDTAKARRALGQRLAAYRRAGSWTQESLAADDRMHYGRSTIANVECGRQSIGRAFWEACDEILASEGALAAEYDRVAAVESERRLAAVKADAPSALTRYELERQDQTDGRIDRRSVLLASIWTVATASGLTYGTAHRRQVGMADVARVRAITGMYRSLDYECGGGALREDVARFAETVGDLLEVNGSDQVRKSLMTAIAEARQLAGWTSFDAGFHSDAQRHWQSAERLSELAGDARLAARIRYCQARQFQHLRHNRDAIQTLRLARDRLASEATPALTAMLDGAEASSLAALGRFDSSKALLRSASVAFDAVEAAKEPEWMGFFTYGEVAAQYGRVFRDMARVEARYGRQAVHWTELAVNEFRNGNVRSGILNEVGLCSALFLAGECERALSVGSDIVGRINQLSSARTFDRVRNLRRDATVRSPSSIVRELDESLRTVRI